ncbi:MAG: FecCD family ABC transporter permease [Enterococcus sp.]
MRRNHFYLLLLSLIFLCCGMWLLSLMNGAVAFNAATIHSALFAFEPTDQAEQIIRNIRLPRLVSGFLVGSSFAVSGALMQGVTRNPLADSGLLGINSGAALGLTVSFILFPVHSSQAAFFFSLGGACVVTLIIFLILLTSRQRITPVRLILVGVAISSFFTALSQVLALTFNLQQDLSFWYVGGVAAITWQALVPLLPIYLLSMLVSLVISSQINCLVMGDEAAVSIGKKPNRIRFYALSFNTVLAGIAVSLVGPVGFIGLIVPHVLRRWTGENYRQLIPLCIFGGGLLVMSADFCARMINPPFETPFGLLIAVIGVPFLLAKVRGVRG